MDFVNINTSTKMPLVGCKLLIIVTIRKHYSGGR